MGRKPGSKNKPKHNGAGETQEQNRISMVDPADPAETMAAKTLRGDVRDRILAEFKGMPKPWQAMNEREQERLIHLAADIASLVVGRAIEIAAAEGAPYVEAQVGKIEITDGLKLHVTAAGTVGNINKLVNNRGMAVLVLIDPAKYSGQRAKAEPDVVGDLAMPREPAGVHGDELPGDAIEGTATEVQGDGLDIPPSLKRLPPPSDANRPDTSNPPFGAPE